MNKFRVKKNKLVFLIAVLLVFLSANVVTFAKYVINLDQDKNNKNSFELKIVPSDIILKSGHEINEFISNKEIKNIVFGNKSKYKEKIANVVGNIISASNSTGVAKIYIVGEGVDKTAYILSENDGKIYANKDSANMFNYSDASLLKSIKFENFDTSNVVSMQGMFKGDNSLETLDITNFNTMNVTDMSDMFANCYKLKAIDVSGLDTSRVTNMQSMFWNCYSIKTLNISKFDTSNVNNMAKMFGKEENSNFQTDSLTSIEFGNIDTSHVTNMQEMFMGCNNITTLDLDKFETSNVTNMKNIFKNCSKLTSLNVSNFNTTNVTDMQGMFDNCRSLTTLNIQNFNTSNVVSMKNMFKDCKSLIRIDVSNFNTAKVTDMSGMFSNCQNLVSLDIQNFDTYNVTTMEDMFNNVSKIINLSLKNFDTSKVENFAGMFTNCTNLTTIFTSEQFVIDSNAIYQKGNGIYMFNGCDKLVGREGTSISSVSASGASNDEIYGKKYAWMDGVLNIKGYFTSTYDEKITISSESNEVEIGSTLQLSAVSTKPESVISWSSSDNNIATIDESGLITPKQVGTVVITAKGTYNDKETITIEVKPLMYSHTINVNYDDAQISVRVGDKLVGVAKGTIQFKVLPGTIVTYEVNKKYYKTLSDDITIDTNNLTTNLEMTKNEEKTLEIVPNDIEYTDGVRDASMALRRAEKDTGTKQYAYCKKSGEFTFTWIFKPEKDLDPESQITSVTTYANICYNSALFTDRSGVYITITDNKDNAKFSYTTDSSKIDNNPERIKVGNTQKITTCSLSDLPTVAQINEGLKYHAKRGTTGDHNLNWYGAHIVVTYIEP